MPITIVYPFTVDRQAAICNHVPKYLVGAITRQPTLVTTG
jgi:hypothetical protein